MAAAWIRCLTDARRHEIDGRLLEARVQLGSWSRVADELDVILVEVGKQWEPASRKGKLQLIDASSFWQKMRKGLGSKRKELSKEHIDDITHIFGAGEPVTRDGVPISRVFKNEVFGYRTITVERPERDASGKVVLGEKGKGKGKPVADADLRDTEKVPLSEDVNTYFKREVLRHAADAWIDDEKTKVG